jgi:hypothetical protein
VERAIESARNRIREMGGKSANRLEDPSVGEIAECRQLASRLLGYFKVKSNYEPVMIHPGFPGCGIIDT